MDSRRREERQKGAGDRAVESTGKGIERYVLVNHPFYKILREPAPATKTMDNTSAGRFKSVILNIVPSGLTG